MSRVEHTFAKLTILNIREWESFQYAMRSGCLSQNIEQVMIKSILRQSR